jgi:hypothetical protein
MKMAPDDGDFACKWIASIYSEFEDPLLGIAGLGDRQAALITIRTPDVRTYSGQSFCRLCRD